jgi:hypothetical protein
MAVAVENTSRRLSPVAKLALVGEIGLVYLRARWALWRQDLPYTIRRLRGDLTSPPEGSPLDPVTYRAGLRLGRAVQRTLPLLPLESRCLMQSLVLSGLLARRGVGTKLVIGVKVRSRFGAHAWVELAGRPLLPASEGDFTRLVEL